MITWITVWVLTVNYSAPNGSSSYQLDYRTQQTCLSEMKKHQGRNTESRCDFKQVPMVIK